MLRFPTALLLSSAVLSPQTSWFAAYLDGAQMVPSVASTRSAWAIVTLLPGNQLTALVHGDGSATAIELRTGAVGNNGPLVLALASGFDGTWNASATVSAAVAANLRAFGLYLQLATAANPGGELRGQVETSRTTRFLAHLDGSQVVPPNASVQTADVKCWLYQPENRIWYGGQIPTYFSTTTARLLRAPTGQNGPQIGTLRGAQDILSGVTDKLSAQDLAALLNDGLYLDVPSPTYPSGEIRGQLRASPGDFVGHASGSQVVPPSGSTATASISAELTATGQLLLAYAGTVQGGTGTTASIQRAPPGQNGTPVWSGTVPMINSTQPLTAAEVADLRAGLFALTYTGNNGAVRCQLLQVEQPVHFGEMPAVSGLRPVISHGARPIIGHAFKISLTGLPMTSGHVVFLLLGLTRDAPYPIDLLPAGLASGSFQYHDLLASYWANFDPTTGFGWWDLPIPYNANLVGLGVHASWLHLTNSLATAVTSNAMTFRLQ